MHQYIKYLVLCFLLSFVATYASATHIDPEKHILSNGYDSVELGDDGKTRFYYFTERTTSSRIAELETEIAKLPKHIDVQKMCDSMRVARKDNLTQLQSSALDLKVTNYGYSGRTVVCVLKYMKKNSVGTQLIYTKKGVGGMYMMFIVD
jgi:hypothetical protein